MSEQYRPQEITAHQELSEQNLLELYSNPEAILGINAKNVRTGDGTIEHKDKPLYTKDLWGCTGVFLESGDKKGLYHLTPTFSEYSYRIKEVSGEGRDSEAMRAMVKKIVDALTKDQSDFSGSKACIIGNIGLEIEGKFSYQVLQKEWELLRQAFQEAGIEQTAVVEVPMDKTMITHTPKHPDTLYVIGQKSSIRDDGGQEVDQKTLVSKKISLRALHSDLLSHPRSFYAHERMRVSNLDLETLDKEFTTLWSDVYDLETAARKQNATPETIERYKKLNITLNALRQEIIKKKQEQETGLKL